MRNKRLTILPFVLGVGLLAAPALPQEPDEQTEPDAAYEPVEEITVEPAYEAEPAETPAAEAAPVPGPIDGGSGVPPTVVLNHRMRNSSKRDASEDVVWADSAGVAISGSSLTKTGGAGWTAGAVSTRALASGDGYVEFTAIEATTDRMAGLSHGDTDRTDQDIDYAVLLRSDGKFGVSEGGVSRGLFGSYQDGDVFRVRVSGGVVTYLQNGSLFYTSAVAPVLPLLVDTSLNTPGATIEKARLAGKLQ